MTLAVFHTWQTITHTTQDTCEPHGTFPTQDTCDIRYTWHKKHVTWMADINHKTKLEENLIQDTCDSHVTYHKKHMTQGTPDTRNIYDTHTLSWAACSPSQYFTDLLTYQRTHSLNLPFYNYRCIDFHLHLVRPKMQNSEKLCLKWNEFQENLNSAFSSAQKWSGLLRCHPGLWRWDTCWYT